MIRLDGDEPIYNSKVDVILKHISFGMVQNYFFILIRHVPYFPTTDSIARLPKKTAEAHIATL